MNSRTSIIVGASSAAALLAVAVATAVFVIPGERVSYDSLAADAIAASTTPAALKPVAHLPTPAAVHGVYMTACVAGTPKARERVLQTIAGTEVNSLVVDIKDYTGTLAYASTSVVGPKGKGCKIYDLPAFIAELHAKGLYAIARVTVFQDPLYSAAHPTVAIQSLSHPGRPWADKHGLAFIDPDHPAYWDYIVAIATEAHAIGFDEVNFDYIRFPTDGDMSDAVFAIPAGATRSLVITQFFGYLRSQLEPAGIVMSADIFGQTTVDRGDMGIGQVFESVLPDFDYVMPMVYPSHFIDGFEGFDNPAAHPYEIIKYTMDAAVERAVLASSTPAKIRPWLQAFDLGAVYTPAMVRDQIKAANDAGLTSWILWDAANQYDRAALEG